MNSQIRRAASSITANIAEGFGRSTSKDKCHFYIMARSSAYEVQNHILYGKEINYFENSTSKELIKEYNNLIYQLNKL